MREIYDIADQCHANIKAQPAQAGLIVAQAKVQLAAKAKQIESGADGDRAIRLRLAEKVSAFLSLCADYPDRYEPITESMLANVAQSAEYGG